MSDTERGFVALRKTVKSESISEPGKVDGERILFTDKTDFIHVNYDESTGCLILPTRH